MRCLARRASLSGGDAIVVGVVLFIERVVGDGEISLPLCDWTARQSALLRQAVAVSVELSLVFLRVINLPF